jgi:hypothetical protein
MIVKARPVPVRYVEVFSVITAFDLSIDVVEPALVLLKLVSICVELLYIAHELSEMAVLLNILRCILGEFCNPLG